MPLRKRAAPGADLVRAELAQRDIAERRRRFREQPAQLLERRRSCLVNAQVLVYDFAECQRRSRTKPLEFAFERTLRLFSRREPAHLRPL